MEDMTKYMPLFRGTLPSMILRIRATVFYVLTPVVLPLPEDTAEDEELLRHVLCVQHQRRVALHTGEEGPQATSLVIHLLTQPHPLDGGRLPLHGAGDDHVKGRTGIVTPD